MSCFDGIITEYPGVSVDKFTGKNLRSQLFFLSHCHSDHMKGLNTLAFANCLSARSSSRIYCSEFSFELLTRQNGLFNIPEGVIKKIVPLSCGVAQALDVRDGDSDKVVYTMSVTLLPAGHCPGSVMFAFDGPKGRVLYTGDFRLYLGQSQKLFSLSVSPLVHPSVGPLVRPSVGPLVCQSVKTLYLDTTFFVPAVGGVPVRTDAVRRVCRVVTQHFERYPKGRVFFDCKTELGYEAVFEELFSHFGEQVHVSPQKYRIYEHAVGTAQALTLDGTTTRLHVCDKDSCCWEEQKKATSLTIALCALGFVVQGATAKAVQKITPNFYKICFSMHSSYSEILEFVQVVQPEKIVPCVVPPGSDIRTVTEMLARLTTTKVSTPPSAESRPKVSAFQWGNVPTLDFLSVPPTPDGRGLSPFSEDLFFEEEESLPKFKRTKLNNASGSGVVK